MVQERTWRGVPALELANDHVRAVVVPAWGAKLASIIHVPSGREWLWQSPHAEPRSPIYGSSYVRDFDLGGWDECFPAIRPGPYPGGPWKGAEIPDHGELWCIPWDVREATGAHVTLAAHGVRFPYRFRRTVRLAARGLVLEYHVENLAPEPFWFIWSAHPLLAVHEGMELHLPAAVGSFRVFSGAPFLAEFDPPRVLPGPGAFAIKCVGPVYGDGRVAVSDGAGEFSLGYRAAEVSHLALWLNFGVWSGTPGAPGYYTIGLEPSIGAGDDLSLAVAHLGEHGLLAPRGSKTWSLDLTLT